ncbi:Growth-regulating factor [Thalictrum thalictroides]|uniref:Growth-regulating factor n=1 Tax=Thalictrum thalictroides TaxID=46969 RepID=A0A7J6X853_THATH|nr:Growth-regulating factor [Thalictrum thalictroides]
MAYHVKQEWYEQYESEHLCCSKLPPRLIYDVELPHQLSESAALPLFVPEVNNRITSLSAFSDSTSTTNTTTARLARLRTCFSFTQWKELELQALIFKYMLIKAPIPAELIDSIKYSLPDNYPGCYLHQPLHLQQYSYYKPSMLRTGYLGSSVDPEPGRCRRTDGKKWRCAKDVVAGQKYCERHMHRGRNRSRKPVEPSTQPIASTGIHFALSVPAPSPQNTRYPEVKQEMGLMEDQCDNKYSGNTTDGGQTRHFFDDWPRSQQGPNGININAKPENLPAGDYQPSSDFSLKLATGNGDEQSFRERDIGTGEQNRLSWGTEWGNHQMRSMGGPLAEALRHSASTSSPTSVLRGAAH